MSELANRVAALEDTVRRLELELELLRIKLATPTIPPIFAPMTPFRPGEVTCN